MVVRRSTGDRETGSSRAHWIIDGAPERGRSRPQDADPMHSTDVGVDREVADRPAGRDALNVRILARAAHAALPRGAAEPVRAVAAATDRVARAGRATRRVRDEGARPV